MTLNKNKIVFKALFEQSKFKPIIYNGKKVYPFDFLELTKERQKIRITFEKTNSSYVQAVCLEINGKIVINNQEIEKGILLREDTIPQKDICLEIISKDKTLTVKNVSIWKKSKNKIVASPEDGTAMIIENLPNNAGKRYFCNDVIADDDFDDLIFKIEYID